MAVLVDSNVLLDVMTGDAPRFNWSAEALERAADRYRLVINPVIYAEVSVRYSRIEDLEAALPKTRPRSHSLRSRVSCRQGVLGLSPARRNKAIAASRFLHRRPCCHRRISVDDAGRRALSHLFPQIVADRSGPDFLVKVALRLDGARHRRSLFEGGIERTVTGTLTRRDRRAIIPRRREPQTTLEGGQPLECANSCAYSSNRSLVPTDFRGAIDASANCAFRPGSRKRFTMG
jgi:hypothetical protein